MQTLNLTSHITPLPSLRKESNLVAKTRKLAMTMHQLSESASNSGLLDKLNKELTQQNTPKKHADSLVYDSPNRHYAVGMIVLLERLPYSDSYANGRLFITSIDNETRTIAGTVMLFGLDGIRKQSKTISLKMSVSDKHYTGVYSYQETHQSSYIVKANTKHIPEHALVIDSYTPLKNENRPKRAKLVSYFSWLASAELRLQDSESVKQLAQIDRIKKAVKPSQLRKNLDNSKLTIPRNKVNRGKIVYSFAINGKAVNFEGIKCKSHKCNISKCKCHESIAKTDKLESLVGMVLEKSGIGKDAKLSLISESIIPLKLSEKWNDSNGVLDIRLGKRLVVNVGYRKVKQ